MRDLQYVVVSQTRLKNVQSIIAGGKSQAKRQEVKDDRDSDGE